jgi:hypothetical protein
LICPTPARGLIIPATRRRKPPMTMGPSSTGRPRNQLPRPDHHRQTPMNRRPSRSHGRRVGSVAERDPGAGLRGRRPGSRAAGAGWGSA